MNKIKNQKIEQFLDDLSSSSATPGGGATAALTAAMAASLVEMVAGLTLGKTGYEKNQKEIRSIKTKAAKAGKILVVLADEDVTAYNSVVAGYGAKDKKRIKTALMRATDVPSDVIKLANQVEKMAARMVVIGNKNAVSDAKSALFLSQSAAKSALENVKINKRALAGIK